MKTFTVFRFVSNPSWQLNVYCGHSDFMEHIVRHLEKGLRVQNVFATPHISSVFEMAERADKIAYSMDGSLATKYVAVIEAYDWTKDTSSHNGKVNHEPEIDDDEVVVLDGVVKELLKFDADCWFTHKITFEEKYGFTMFRIMERYPEQYEQKLKDGLIGNLVSWG